LSLNETQNSELRREDWETPDGLFGYLNLVFDFWVDLAASPENSKCKLFLTESMTEEETLSVRRKVGSNWAFVNPPYKSTSNKMRTEMERAFSWDSVVGLIPAALCNEWFKPIYTRCSDIFLLGRIPFKGASAGAKFDVCLVVRDVFKKLTEGQNDSLVGISKKHIRLDGQVGGRPERELLLRLCREATYVGNRSDFKDGRRGVI
jgi:phage N-6-adenine-methyltransferase